MKIEVYLDDADQPFQVIDAPNRFRIDSSTIPDGQHVLRFRAVDEQNIVSERLIPFNVQNGPEIAIHGIKSGETVSGNFSVLANAYSAVVGDEFEPHRIETPAPIPTWAWLLFLVILSWGAGYLSQELHQEFSPQYFAQNTTKPSVAKPEASETAAVEDSDEFGDWQALGDQVYGNNCSACHQATGQGLAGVFPSLVGNAVVLAEDPSEHIVTILEGLSGKTIDGVAYASPMPAFAAMLSDAEIAAVVNHERTEWGNQAPLAKAEDVAKLRK